MEKLVIRLAEENDAEELLAIYAPYITDTAVTYEYEIPAVEEFRNRIRKTLERYPYLVAEQAGEIVGYAYAGQFHPRAAYAWAAEMSIYLKMNKKRMGIGRRLYDTLEKILADQNILNLYACIAWPQEEDEYLTEDSIRFHERMGYKIVGKFPECAYKFGRWYGMVWMEKQIGEHTEKPGEVVSFRQIERGNHE